MNVGNEIFYQISCYLLLLRKVGGGKDKAIDSCNVQNIKVVLRFRLQTCNLIQSNLIPRKSSVSASTKKANVFIWSMSGTYFARL